SIQVGLAVGEPFASSDTDGRGLASQRRSHGVREGADVVGLMPEARPLQKAAPGAETTTHANKSQTHGKNALERFSEVVCHAAGSSPAFGIAFLVVLVWALTGPIFRYSDPWQLVINTGTTIVTFLMVFLIQRSQNKESLAVQLKLNEIVAAIQGASNRLIDVEKLSENDLATLHAHYEELVNLAKKDGRLT